MTNGDKLLGATPFWCRLSTEPLGGAAMIDGDAKATCMSPLVPKLGWIDGIRLFLSPVCSTALFRCGVFCKLLSTFA